MDSKKDIVIPLVVALMLIVLLGLFTLGAKDEQIELSDDTQKTEINEQTMDNLKIEDTVVGTGEEAVAGKTVVVNYIGRFEDGKLFDTSVEEVAKAEGAYNPGRDYSTGFAFQIGAGMVIAGWDQGFAGMKVGGKRTITVPPELGYGMNDYGPIPGGSTLVFEVELLEVK